MDSFPSIFFDALIFIALPWAIWRVIRGIVPLAVLPILLGMIFSALHLPLAELGVPSPLGNQLGFIGVILLAFTAGLEMRQSPEREQTGGTPIRYATIRPLRIAMSAALALAVPFAVGTLASRYYFLDLPRWAPALGKSWLTSAAIGLCIAVSALPVLVALVRELKPEQKPLGLVALNVALIDDAALWIGLAALQIAANVGTGMHWHYAQMAALAAVALLSIAGWATNRYTKPVHPALAWGIAALFLAVGAWASAKLGIHELIGAYVAGALLPPHWMRRIHIERVGRFGLMVLAPLFFGHSGLSVNGSVLGWDSTLGAAVLLVLSTVSKMGAIAVLPPASEYGRRETLAIGALLQCKGLMEIVAATLLHAQGLLSEYAYAALVTLAVASTLLTGPVFQFILRGRRPKRSGPHLAATRGPQ